MASENEDQKTKEQKGKRQTRQGQRQGQKRSRRTRKRGNSVETLEDAFIHMLSDMRNAEEQLTKALPRMANAASDPELADVFQTHQEETQRQIKLIDKVAKALKIKLMREKCEAMEGLIMEGKDIIKAVKDGSVRDVLLIAAAQKVEHYEIASYGSLIAIAEQFSLFEAVDHLEQILEEEKWTDEKLSRLAEQGGINEDAAQEEEDSRRRGEGRSRSSRDDYRDYKNYPSYRGSRQRGRGAYPSSNENRRDYGSRSSGRRSAGR